MFPPPPCAKEMLWSFPNPQKKSTFSQIVQKNALMNIQLLRKCVQHVKYLNKISAFLLLAIWALLIVSSWCQLELIWWLPCFFSTVQHECIPQAILGMDIICQAKSGMGKTAVFVLATLQQLEQVDGQVSVLVMCHTRELAFQISKEYERFSKYMNNIKVSVFFGGISIKKDQQTLKTNCPHIVVGTPGRILALTREKTLNLKHIKHFILDECDKMLEQLGKKCSH